MRWDERWDGQAARDSLRLDPIWNKGKVEEFWRIKILKESFSCGPLEQKIEFL